MDVPRTADPTAGRPTTGAVEETAVQFVVPMTPTLKFDPDANARK